MIQLIGLKHNIDISIREKLSIVPRHVKNALNKIIEFSKGVIILSTCNRTEIYFDCDMYGEEALNKIFELLDWNKEYKEYVFIREEESAIEHLMEVTCGFHSKILGEDQILSQVKDAFEISKKNNTTSKSLYKLFQLAITCGKEFRWKSGMYKIPISSASIVAKESKNKDITSYMIIGYGEVGKLVEKYLVNDKLEKLYIVVRYVEVHESKDDRINYISFKEKVDYYDKVQCIISCTSSPHIIVKKEELPKKPYLIFDMAIPRDVDESIRELEWVEVIDIDSISAIDDENKQIRKEVMNQNRVILEKYIKEYEKYKVLNEIVPHIRKIKSYGDSVYKDRYETFINKKDSKNNEELAQKLLKSTSDLYVNRAIEVLKEEQLKGCGDECMRILQKIFIPQE
ncbi:glutamyl-tRNA reductase [Clostridium grantii]|uniref:Glutamyl-tRNA reductase n=1 Tax=Clostridium grantii DSM 8605 TaxID=1121316 RepID=A0A1M5V4I1_9CLOT|nr:glutamyl-tRNA reductase [Clostridium grantii]SHH70177.1 glutamyl-tRNA reductase [Clostridium grantii DSM 8605]